MQTHIIAVGTKMPKWCLMVCDDYLKRLQRYLKCTLIEIPCTVRHKGGLVSHYKEEEANKILQKISKDDYVVALDEKGTSLSTLQLAEDLTKWRQAGNNLRFVIGGPDGLSPRCLERANQCWSLSALTLPHAMVRMIVLEQLYRGATCLVNHPYHRA